MVFNMSNCPFCNIISKKIPAKTIYEDDEIIAFNDINPKAEIHFMVIPKLHIDSMLQLDESHIPLIGKMMVLANKIALKQKLQGYKVHINTGQKGGQEVFHLHIHVFGNL